MDIHIFWDGPYSIKDLKKLDTGNDYGIYQVYGFHKLYGKDVLLYIGKANQQTFCKRLKQEHWDEKYDTLTSDPNNTRIYVGRMADKNAKLTKWERSINLAEKFLIYTHNPILNKVNTTNVNFKELKDLHIFNWGVFRDILPEVSWKRWSEYFDDITEDDILGVK